jgi:hypothetical protein
MRELQLEHHEQLRHHQLDRSEHPQHDCHDRKRGIGNDLRRRIDVRRTRL